MPEQLTSVQQNAMICMMPEVHYETEIERDNFRFFFRANCTATAAASCLFFKNF